MSGKNLFDRVSNLARLICLVVVIMAFTAGICAADVLGSTSSFLQHEATTLGSVTPTNWRSQNLFDHGASSFSGVQGIGDRSAGGIGDVVELEQSSGPSNLGSKFKVGLYSAILPGAGQFYNGQKKKAAIMAGAEVAIWTSYIVFNIQGNNRMDSSIEWAGIYAGTSGGHSDNYWQNVGSFMNSDDYNISRMRDARAVGEPVTGLVDSADSWQWVNRDRYIGYIKQRADANSAYNRRDFVLLFAVINRAISVVDAVMGVGSVDEALHTEVLGMGLGLEMLPSLSNPGARCVVSRKF